MVSAVTLLTQVWTQQVSDLVSCTNSNAHLKTGKKNVFKDPTPAVQCSLWQFITWPWS